MKYQNWANFEEPKTWILYIFKIYYNQLLKAGTMFTNRNTKYVYKKIVESGSRGREDITSNTIE